MSRYSSYDDASAVCPYYKGGTKLEVRCEGCAPGQAVLLRFAADCFRRDWRSGHCDKLPGYEKCPFYRAHEE